MQIYLPFLPAILYLFAALMKTERQAVAGGIVVLACVLHGIFLGLDVFTNDTVRVGFASMLSTALWVSVIVYCLENRHFALEPLKVLLLPSAAVGAVLPVFFRGNLIVLAGKSTMFPWHLAVASLTYCTLTVAAFHVLTMKMQNMYLQPRQAGSALPNRVWLRAAVERLPALLTMEKILFRLVFGGFILLSLTVLSGVVFSEQVLGVAFKWDHKTVFSLLSWILFAILLIGRQWRGWRGKKVLSFTLLAFTCLMLAYVGSRFVLEVVLHRGVS